jgi:hypothetical protein
MNTYRYLFIAACPNNQRRIVYELELLSNETVMVETIVEACREIKTGYHEDIADMLHDQLGHAQIIRAHHHGVDIETVRP